MDIYFPGDEWEQKLPEEVGFTKNAFLELENDRKARYQRINSIVVLKNGYIVYEKYAHGCQAGTLCEIMSATKSVVSALLGIAIQEKFIQGNEQRLVEFFPEYLSDESDFFLDEITIEQLLTMTSGIFWEDGTKGNEKMCERMNHSQNWIEFLMKLPFQPEWIDKFRYSSANSHLLSGILSKATGMNAHEFAKKELFEPIGIKNSSWRKDPQGICEGSSWLALTTRDMARLGLLYLSRGKWNNKQVIPEDWVKQSVSPKNDGNDIGKYGYQWWIGKSECTELYFAMGYGGQLIAVLPENNIVVAITARLGALHSQIDNPINLLYNYIIKK